jgi:hypothetical protein
LACAAATLGLADGARGAPRPAWLTPRSGSEARVEIAPWLVWDEPEAALTERSGSLARDFTADGTRPEDVVYEPVGVRVRVVRVLRASHGSRSAAVALVHGRGARWQAYAPLGRLVPEIPPGAHLRVAGGFGGFAEFFPALDTPPARALQIATGTDVVALGMDTARYDAAEPFFVRARVRVGAGALRGRTGWIPTAYLGAAVDGLPPDAGSAEAACSCLLLQFAEP